jgi:N-acetylglutamate synthase-like GNAT family acetyltransferase
MPLRNSISSRSMVGKIVIRPASVSERESLEALQTRASLGNPRDREALLANPDAVELPVSQIEAGQVFVAEQDGTVAGFAAILRRVDGDTELDGLFVEPGRWREGIGRRLLEHCATVARLAQSTALCVVGNPQAQGFYDRCGFEYVGTAETRFGIGLRFRKVL